MQFSIIFGVYFNVSWGFRYYPENLQGFHEGQSVLEVQQHQVLPKTQPREEKLLYCNSFSDNSKFCLKLISTKAKTTFLCQRKWENVSFTIGIYIYPCLFSNKCFICLYLLTRSTTGSRRSNRASHTTQTILARSPIRALGTTITLKRKDNCCEHRAGCDIINNTTLSSCGQYNFDLVTSHYPCEKEACLIVFNMHL